jgi:hypothetical protein
MNTQLTFFPEPTPPTQPGPASPLSPSLSPSPSFPSVKVPTPFASAFDHFTLEQRKQIIAWNDKHTYDQTVDLIQKEFGITVSRSSLARFHTRTALINHVEESPDTQAAADLILLHITSPNPNNHKLTAASIQVLEQTAFKLALTSADKPAHLDLLNRVNLIICRARNTAVRERHATVQETKCALRAQELELKRSHLNRNLNLNLPNNKPLGGARSPSPTSFSRDAADQTDAAQADLTVEPNPEIHNSEFIIPNSSSTPTPNPETTNDDSDTSDISEPELPPCPLPRAVIEANARHAELLLSGQIQTHYKRDPENSLLAKMNSILLRFAPHPSDLAAQAQIAPSLDETATTADATRIEERVFPRPRGGEGQGEGVALENKNTIHSENLLENSFALSASSAASALSSNIESTKPLTTKPNESNEPNESNDQTKQPTNETQIITN